MYRMIVISLSFSGTVFFVDMFYLVSIIRVGIEIMELCVGLALK